MRQTTISKPVATKRQWYLVDAKHLVLGRMASEVAQILRGKHKPSFIPHVDGGDCVVVINAARVYLSGKKAINKNYYHHSRYPGGLKITPYHHMTQRKPTFAVERAVRLMLPKNKLGSQMLSHLYVYPDQNHHQQAQKPIPYKIPDAERII